MKKLIALAATSLLVLGGCATGSDEPETPEVAAPTTSETVEVTEHEIKVGEPFTMNSPHFVAHVTVTDVFRPDDCGEVDEGVNYPTFIGIAMDVEVESGNGEGYIPNGVTERSKDGFLKDNRGLSAVTCEDYEELSAVRVRTGEKYRGVQWLQEDVAPDSEIIIEPQVSAQESDVTEIYVLNLSEFDLGGEVEPTTKPTAKTNSPATPAPAAVAPTAPTFSYCYLADGTAMMSDGTTTYMDTCNESAGGPPRLADGRSIYELDTPSAPQSDSFPPHRAPEVEAEKQAGHSWWAECMAGNTAEYCRANDPWQG